MRLSALNKQQRFYMMFGILGVYCYGIMLYAVVLGNPIATFIAALYICFGLHSWMVYLSDGKTPWQLHDHRRQSWAYMYGDVLLSLALAITAWTWHDYKDRLLWLANPWWIIGISSLAFVLGFPFRAVDRKRYRKHHALKALKNPGSIVHNWIVVPSMIGALLVTSFPLLLLWNQRTAMVATLVLLWCVLVVVDDKLRFVNPQWQYKPWDEKTYEPAASF